MPGIFDSEFFFRVSFLVDRDNDEGVDKIRYSMFSSQFFKNALSHYLQADSNTPEK